MSRLRCICGHLNRYRSYNEHELSLFIKRTLINTIGEIIDDSLSEDEIEDRLLFGGQDVYRCEKCKRLYIQDIEDGKLVVHVYALEETERQNDDEDS